MSDVQTNNMKINFLCDASDCTLFVDSMNTVNLAGVRVQELQLNVENIGYRSVGIVNTEMNEYQCGDRDTN